MGSEYFLAVTRTDPMSYIVSTIWFHLIKGYLKRELTFMNPLKYVSHDPLQIMLISTVLPWSIYFGVLCVWYQNDTPIGRRLSRSIAPSGETEQYETILQYKNDNWLCFGWNTPHQSNQSKCLSLEIADYYERQLWFLFYLDLHIQSKFNYKTCLSAICN